MELRARLATSRNPTSRPSPPSTPAPPTSCARPAPCGGSTSWRRGSPAGNGTRSPRVERPVGLVFAADHGVAAAAKVSALDPEVTAAMFAAFKRGPLDDPQLRPPRRGLGVGTRRRHRQADRRHPRRGGAVTRALRRDRRRRQAKQSTLSTATSWSLGEMGIGNTTASAAVAAALAGGEAAAWVGRGTGIDDAALSRQARGRAASRAAHRRRHRSARGPPRGRRLRARRHRRGGRRRPPSLAAGGPRRLRRDVVGAPPRHDRARRCSTTAPSDTARPSRATASSSTASASARCSTSTCASARAAGRWPPSRSSPWPAPASPRSPRSRSGSAR